MAFQYLTNVPLDQAVEEYLRVLCDKGMAPAEEIIPVAEAAGRVTAQAVYAHICAPHYHACAMDGIAVTASRTFGAGETTPVTLQPGEYVQVDTGDPLPEGCDAVVMIEDVVQGENGSVRLYVSASPWQHIRQIGEDICAGEMILPALCRITPAAVGAMIAGGVLQVPVIKKPLVGVIPTGDEIVYPTADPGPGDILEFNSAIFCSMLRQWGAEAKAYPIVKDDFRLIKAAVEQGLNECDMVILNAGSSAGRDDLSCRIIGEVGDVLYHGIAIRPGKPAILGYSGAKPLLGVPGYPVSGIIVIEQILKPLIDYCCGNTAAKPETVEAVLGGTLVSGTKYREFVRTQLGLVGGKMVAVPLNRGSGVVTSFMKADGIIDIPQEQEGYEAGETVKVKLLRSREELAHTLIATGSHDPLLDELRNMLHLACPEYYMSSSHVGSMGGIMAIRRGQAHLAGIHLLNEEDGVYNTAYVQKYFPNGGVRLVECVGRIQGLMVKKGNPLGIRDFRDIAADGLHYVNRQKGSGTRILADHLCRKYGMDSSAVCGYDREEFTHTAVAAQIAQGGADAGMGIWSAASLYDLDFLPVCVEQYDLLIPDHAWDNPMLQKLLEILAGSRFREKLMQMGGYQLENPGRVRQHF